MNIKELLESPQLPVVYVAVILCITTFSSTALLMPSCCY